MEKKFLVVKCRELEDLSECDADREVVPQLFTLNEVKKEYTRTKWYCFGENGPWFKTHDEAVAAFRRIWRSSVGGPEPHDADGVEKALAFCDGTVIKRNALVEVYEIMDDGTMEKRDDLSTYYSLKGCERKLGD